MKMTPETSRSISVQLKQYEQVERDLNKLKFHLKMKKRAYEQEEYKNINERLKECQFYFKKMKKGIIQTETNTIVSKNRNNHSEMKKKKVHQIQMERKTLDNNRHVIKNLNSKEENFRIKLRTEQSQLSKSKFILQYDLEPLKKYEYGQNDNSPFNRISKRMERTKNGRFVSDFEKNIKERLGKIALDKYQDVEDFDSIVERSQQEKGAKINQVSKRPFLKLDVPIPNHSSRSNKKQTPNNRQQGRSTDFSQSQRLGSLCSRARRCRTDLAQRQKDQISRISQQKMDFSKKSEILSNFYQRFSSNQKNGDPKALQLMSIATLARADLLLKQI